MSSPDSDLSVSLPPELHEWLSEQAGQEDMESGEFLRSLLESHRMVHQEGELTSPDQDLQEFRGEFMQLIEDVRERVIQVKQETDQKAPADHSHPELLEQVNHTADGIEEIETELEQLNEQIQSLETDLENGFENYEDILEQLVTETDRMGDRLHTLGEAVLDTRNQLRDVVAAQQRVQAVEELKETANKHGVTTGKCEECSGIVRIGLLTEPKCPHCSTTFTDIEPVAGFRRLFGSATLQTGDKPALTSGTESRLDDEIESQLTEEGPDSASVSWGQIDNNSTEQS